MTIELFKDQSLNLEISKNEKEVLFIGWYFAQEDYELIKKLTKSTDGDKFTQFKIKELKADFKLTAADKKKAITRASNDWYELLTQLLNKDLYITVIPSSSTDKTNSGLHGIRELANKLITGQHCKDGLTFLQRTEDTQKVATGGDRSIEIHEETISADAQAIHGKTILLMDDVLTTGNSMAAARKKLLDAGAAKVYCLSLAKTYSYLLNTPMSPIQQSFLGKVEQIGVRYQSQIKNNHLNAEILTKHHGSEPSPDSPAANANSFFSQSSSSNTHSTSSNYEVESKHAPSQ